MTPHTLVSALRASAQQSRELACEIAGYTDQQLLDRATGCRACGELWSRDVPQLIEQAETLGDLWPALLALKRAHVCRAGRS